LRNAIAVIDFTSALYLGLRHGSGSLRPWAQLTTGTPAALAEAPAAGVTAGRLAALIGCERAILAPSTLHLFWDLFGMVRGGEYAIYLDAGAYPVARWGAERAAAGGVPLHSFAAGDVAALRRLLRQHRGLRPIVVTDGFRPGGGAVPLEAYLACVQTYGGQLIVDDTQSLGIFGHSANAVWPYGIGGGGSLRRRRVGGRDVVVVSSLAKAFGVPLAVLAGSGALIDRFEAASETRVHCSPPSLAAIHAAEHALDLNDEHGDALRLRLAQNVRRFRRGLAVAGLGAAGGLFPVQTLQLPEGVDAPELHSRLLGEGIRTYLQRRRGRPCLSFIITAGHRGSEIDEAVAAVAGALADRAAQGEMDRGRG
jgi:8-amino-7-oxononanoate synthase